MSIDLNTLNELKEIMGEDFGELISIFITDSQNQIDALKAAIDAENIKDVQRIAHTIKGSSANLGVNVLSESSRVLEHQASEGSLANAGEFLEKIIIDYNDAKKILEESF